MKESFRQCLKCFLSYRGLPVRQRRLSTVTLSIVAVATVVAAVFLRRLRLLPRRPKAAVEALGKVLIADWRRLWGRRGAVVVAAIVVVSCRPCRRRRTRRGRRVGRQVRRRRELRLLLRLRQVRHTRPGEVWEPVEDERRRRLPHGVVVVGAALVHVGGGGRRGRPSVHPPAPPVRAERAGIATRAVGQAGRRGRHRAAVLKGEPGGGASRAEIVPVSSTMVAMVVAAGGAAAAALHG